MLRQRPARSPAPQGGGVEGEYRVVEGAVSYTHLDVYKRQGSYMAKGLEVRDQWESKLLRTSSWSPFR